MAGKETSAGFASLLRRSIRPEDIILTCFAEWKSACGRQPAPPRAWPRSNESSKKKNPVRPDRDGLWKLTEPFIASLPNDSESTQHDSMNKADQLKEALAATRQEVSKVIIGQQEVIDKALIPIFTGNHALIEGVPGVAKTLLVRTLARVLGCEFGRIQFTPDLMPADITGTNVFSLQRNEFTLIKGPVFTSFLLADEINRAPAKTQSALLQAMQERQVSIDLETHTLSPNFTVFATQNPIEYEGTYPLPEAQKDRFMLKITMNIPERDDELALARRMLGKDSPEASLAAGNVRQVLTPETLADLRAQLDLIVVRDDLVTYVVELMRASRKT